MGVPSVQSWLEGQRDSFRTNSVPLYGLDQTWDGSRWAGGWGSGTGGSNFELGHGDPKDDSAQLVRITTWSGSGYPQSLINYIGTARQLAQQIWQHGCDYADVRPTFQDQEPTQSWNDISILVEGELISFRSLAARPWWVAIARIDEMVVSICARCVRPEEVSLVVIGDVDLYLTGLPPW